MKIAGRWSQVISGRAVTGQLVRVGPAGDGVRDAIRKAAQQRFLAGPGTLPAPSVEGVAGRTSAVLDPATFVYACVRMISADVVPGYWVDYTNPAVLQDAVERKLFDRLPVFSMHDARAENWLGFVGDGAAWDQTLMGEQQVPGVTAEVAIVPGASARAWTVAHGVMAGSLTRWSLGFMVEMEPSHPEMEEQEFLGALGFEGPDGRPVLWNAQRLQYCKELSLVDDGAVESARTKDVPAMPTATRIAQSRFLAPRPKPPVSGGGKLVGCDLLGRRIK